MKKVKLKLLLLFSLFFLATHLLIFVVVAQEKDEKSKKTVEERNKKINKELENDVNSHFQSFSDKLVVSLSLDNSRYVYDILEGGKELLITPNTPVRTNIALSYKFLRFQYGISNLFNDVEVYKFGKTKDFNIKLNIFIKSFRQIISIHTIRGMYLVNTKELKENYVEGQPMEQYDNMYRYSIKGQSSFNTNPNFSHKAFDLHNARQKRSAFSFTPYVIYSYNRITNLPQDLPISLPVSLENIDINFQPRAYYNLVFKQSVFFLAMVYPDFGYRYSIREVHDADSGVLTKHYKNILLVGTGFRMQLGYNSPRCFAGTSLSFNLIVSDAKNIFLIEANEYVSLYFGYRFTAPNFLKKIIDKAKLMIDLQ